MKKTIVTITIAAMLSSVAVPAFADDMLKRLIIGGVGMAVGEMMKGGGKGGQRAREPRRGDTMLGRVGENDRPDRNSGSRKRNSVAPAAGAAVTVAAAAIVLPESGPQIEARPSETEIAALLARPLSNVDDDGQSVAMVDEDGVTWGNVTPETADKVDKAVGLGMLRSQAIAALTDLKGPQPTKEQEDALIAAAVEDADNTPPAGEPQAVTVAQADDRSGSFGTVWSRDRSKGTVIDETGNVWGDFPASTIAQIDNATASGVKRSEAIAAHTEWASPGRTKAQVAAEAAQQAEQERKFAEAQHRAEEAAKAEQERIAAAKVAREKARAEEIAAAERKREDDAQRAAAEAALPDILRGSEPQSVAVSPSTTPSAPAMTETLPAIDAQTTTASTKSDTTPKAVIDVAPAQPEKVAPAKKSGMKIDL